MGRLREFMDKLEREEEQELTPDLSAREEILNRQKQTDLQRAQARSVARPIKKELRHSQIEGRYIRPEEVKKEIEKLEQAKKEAEERKKGLFGRVFGRIKKKKTIEPAVPVGTAEAPEEEKAENNERSVAEKKKKAEQIRRLRGIALAEKIRAAKEAEERYLEMNGLTPTETVTQEFIPREGELGFIPPEENIPFETRERTSFTEAVQRLSETERNPQISERPSFDPVDEAENARRLFAPIVSNEPDKIIATALSAAVGFIYWDEDGQRIDRIITIRRLFSRQGDILIDAFCHDIAAPRLIAFSRGIRMYNLQTMKPYENPRDFLLYHITGQTQKNVLDVPGFAAALSIVRYELTALVFVAASDFNRTDKENKLMLEYISRRCPTIDFDENEMLDYIAMLVPDEQSFSEALEIVVKQPQEIVLQFVRTFLQMMLSDGVLHENERDLLAELLYLLRIEGIELSRIGLE